LTATAFIANSEQAATSGTVGGRLVTLWVASSRLVAGLARASLSPML
jgi:hypothetical protein